MFPFFTQGEKSQVTLHKEQESLLMEEVGLDGRVKQTQDFHPGQQ